MIAIKIIFTDDTVNFANLRDAVTFFLASRNNVDKNLMPHAVDTISNQQWIVNQQTFELINSHTMAIVNYSTDAKKAQLFADSLTFWSNVIPETSSCRVEQYPVSEIPANAVSILVDNNFYLSQETI